MGQTVRRRWLPATCLAVLAGTAGCGDPDNTLPIGTVVQAGGAAGKADAPQVVVVGRRTDAANKLFVVELALVNPLDVPVTYHGYRLDAWQARPAAGRISPFYQVLAKTPGGWENATFGRCGTGAGTMNVRPREAGRFDARVRLPQTLIKVGLRCRWTDENGAAMETTAWTGEIDPPLP